MYFKSGLMALTLLMAALPVSAAEPTKGEKCSRACDQFDIPQAKRDQILSLHRDHMKQMRATRIDLRIAQLEKKKLMLDSSVSESDFMAQMDKIQALQRTMAVERFRFQKAVRELFTAEEYSKWQMHQQRRSRMHGRQNDWGGDEDGRQMRGHRGGYGRMHSRDGDMGDGDGMDDMGGMGGMEETDGVDPTDPALLPEEKPSNEASPK